MTIVGLVHRAHALEAVAAPVGSIEQETHLDRETDVAAAEAIEDGAHLFVGTHLDRL